MSNPPDSAFRPNSSEASAAEPQAVDWYLYFQDQEHADRAASTLRREGIRVLVRPGAYGGWLTLATTDPPSSDEEFAALEERMRQVAESFDGEFDGWQGAVGD